MVKKKKNILFKFLLVLILVFILFFLFSRNFRSAVELPFIIYKYENQKKDFLKKEFTELDYKFLDKSYGCGNIFVYKLNEENTTGIMVRADKEKLKLSSKEKLFDIKEEEDLYVEISRGLKLESEYCTDALGISSVFEKMIAIEGEVIISINELDEEEPYCLGLGDTYRAKVTLKNLVFVDKNSQKEKFFIEEVSFDSCVGWYTG